MTRENADLEGGDPHDDVTEHDIWLTSYDMDHLNDGQPVFKGIGEDVRLVLRPRELDTETDQ